MTNILTTILKKENLSYTTEPEKLSHGEENLNYLINQQTEKRVLRIFEKKRTSIIEGSESIEKEIEYEKKLLKKLFAIGFPVPQILKTGKVNEKVYQVQSFLEGSHVTPDKINKEQCEEIGRVLARFHIATRNNNDLFSKPSNDLFSFSFEDKIGKVFENKIESEFGQSFLTRLLDKKNELKQKIVPHKTRPQCIVHNDFFYWNIKFKGNKISGVMDFDEACPGNTLSDLAATLIEYYLYKRNNYPENYSAILNAYNDTTPVKDLTLVRDLMKHRALYNIFYALFYFFERPNKADYYLEKIKRTIAKLAFLENDSFVIQKN